MNSRIVATLLLLVIIHCASSTDAAEVGLFIDQGYSSLCPLSKFVPPQVNIQVHDFGYPIAAIHFSLDFASGSDWFAPPEYWEVPASGEFDDLAIRFDECLEAANHHLIWLSYAVYEGEEREVVCMGPPASTTTDPPAVVVETCDGQYFGLPLAESFPTEVPRGCLWVCELVPVLDPSWGMLKVAF